MQASTNDWLSLNFKDIRNIRDFMTPIDWTEEKLVELLAERIKKDVEGVKDKKEWEYWKFFFDIKTKTEFNNFKDYLFERIVNGPRDIIQHCNMAQEAAEKQKMNRISFELLQDIEPAYSKELLDAISQENSKGSYYNGIYHFISNAFYKGEAFYSKLDLFKKLEDDWFKMHDDYKDFEWFRYSGTGIKLTEKLYRVGFLGYKKDDRVVFGWQSQDITDFEKASVFAIRTAYRKALSIT